MSNPSTSPGNNRTADYYRNRPSEEILEEQRQLDRLRTETFTEDLPRWQWSRHKYKFEVSKKWEELTGYKAEDAFPQNLSPKVPVEGLLDNFIDMWLEMATPDCRKYLDKKLTKFIRANHSSAVTNFQYILTCADGTEKAVATKAQSIWKDGFLMELFVQTMDMSPYYESTSQAVEIYRNKKNLKSLEAKAKGQTEDIQSLADRTKKLAENLTAMKAILPLFTALVIWFGEEIPELVAAIVQTAGLIANPPAMVQSNDLENDVYSFQQLPEDVKEKVEAVLVKGSPLGLQVKFAAYAPGKTPATYRVLRIAQQDATYSGTRNRPPVSTSNSSFENTRTGEHVSGNRPYEYTNGSSYQYSVPFTLINHQGRQQTFYVAINANSPDEKRAQEIQAYLREAAEAIREILREAYNTGG